MGRAVPRSATEAVRYGYIPAAPLQRVLERWTLEGWSTAEMNAHEDGLGLGALKHMAEATGIHQDTLIKIRAGGRQWTDFDQADKIVTYINVDLWHTDPELAACYQSVDLTYLDAQVPTGAAVAA